MLPISQVVTNNYSVLIPWVTLREVPVEVEIPSPKVAVLKFERGMQQGLLGRISRTSVMEYHAFGIISEGRKATHHYMICGVQGDFTRNLVTNPPKTVWTRQLKFGMSCSHRPIQAFTNIRQPVSATPQQCTNAASASALEPASVQRSQHAFKVPTGS